MFVIGTAGHVDHGKSALIEALSGINPDRLREEQERHMTIDLGFAWLTLPSGREVSVIDVPGHEDFVKNMLAGIGGVDVALLVVAADEAVMPQTREHLDILDLLRVPRGVVALTKVDLVEDQGWLDLVEAEIEEELSDTVLAGAPVVRVSALEGTGLDALRAELDRLIEQAGQPRDVGRPRLALDRAFSLSGFGTIVTGTLIEGSLQVGQTVEIVPGELSARIRGLQAHKTDIEEATPGSRVAVNLSGVDVDELWRGQVLTFPGWLEPTQLVDTRLRVLDNAPWPVEHDMALEFYQGAARIPCRVRLLSDEALYPGEEGWVQYSLDEPLAAVRGDRYVVRLPSPSVTIGGGRILETQPIRRHRRFDPQVDLHLEALASGDPILILEGLMDYRPVIGEDDLVAASQLPEEEARRALDALVRDRQLVRLGSGQDALILTVARFEEALTGLLDALRAFHGQHPLRLGTSPGNLRAAAETKADLFSHLLDRLDAEGRVRVIDGPYVSLPDHEVTLDSEQESEVQRMLEAFAGDPYAPPTLDQVEETLGPELTTYLLQSGRLVKVSDEVAFATEAYDEMRERLVAYMRQHETATVAEIRDLFASSRRYVLAFLEHMDSERVTKRMGDVRVLRATAAGMDS